MPHPSLLRKPHPEIVYYPDCEPDCDGVRPRAEGPMGTCVTPEQQAFKSSRTDVLSSCPPLAPSVPVG